MKPTIVSMFYYSAHFVARVSASLYVSREVVDSIRKRD